MIRRTPLQRSTKPISKRRAKPRRTTMLRDAGYRAWLRERGYCPVCNPCVWQIDGTAAGGPCGCDAAHTERGGMSMKGPDSSCAPLCRVHHREYDAEHKAFEVKYGIDMKAVAKAWWDLYQRRKSA